MGKRSEAKGVQFIPETQIVSLGGGVSLGGERLYMNQY
jgi:hypothetical protein